MNNSQRKDSEKATRDRPILLTILATLGMAMIYAIKVLIEMIKKGRMDNHVGCAIGIGFNP